MLGCVCLMWSVFFFVGQFKGTVVNWAHWQTFSAHSRNCQYGTCFKNPCIFQHLRRRKQGRSPDIWLIWARRSSTNKAPACQSYCGQGSGRVTCDLCWGPIPHSACGISGGLLFELICSTHSSPRAKAKNTEPLPSVGLALTCCGRANWTNSINSLLPHESSPWLSRGFG